MKRHLFDSIVNQLINKYGITKEELYEKTKDHSIVNTRYLLFYICSKRNITVASMRKLLKSDGFDMTYSTILKGISAMKERIKEDQDYTKIINEIK